MSGMSLDDLFSAGVSALAGAIKERSLTALEVVEFAYQKIENFPKQMGDQTPLNAFIHLEVSKAAAIAKAKELDALDAGTRESMPLFGVPLVVKDNIQVVGHRSTAGSAPLDSFMPTESAEVVEKLEAAGAVILAKNNLHELAWGVSSKNFTYGSVRNPHCLTRIAGGSSGGTGAAVGASFAPGGLGTDTGGSVRIPATVCGIAGLRPTAGRYPTKETPAVVPISHTRDIIGPLARCVEDLMILDAVTMEAPYAPEPAASFKLGCAKVILRAA